MLKNNAELFRLPIFESMESAEKFTNTLIQSVRGVGFHESKSFFDTIIGALMLNCGEESLANLYQLYLATNEVPEEVLEELVASYPALTVSVYHEVLPSVTELISQSEDLASYAYGNKEDLSLLKFDLDYIKNKAVDILDVEDGEVVMLLNLRKPLLAYNEGSNNSSSKRLAGGALVRIVNKREVDAGVYEVMFDVLLGYQPKEISIDFTTFERLVGRFNILEFKEELVKVAYLEDVVSEQVDHLLYGVGNIPEGKSGLTKEEKNLMLGLYHTVEVHYNLTNNVNPDFILTLERKKSGSYKGYTQTVHTKGRSYPLLCEQHISPYFKLADLDELIQGDLSKLTIDTEGTVIEDFNRHHKHYWDKLVKMVLSSPCIDFHRIRPHLPILATQFILASLSDEQYKELVKSFQSGGDTQELVHTLVRKVTEKVARLNLDAQHLLRRAMKKGELQ